MRRKRPILIATTITVLGIVGVALLAAAALSWLGDRFDQVMNASPRRLVYDTDHQAVLDACRQVLKDPEAAGFPPAKNGYSIVSGSQGGGTAPASLPAVLRDLEFEDMLVSDDEAVITFGGGFGHWGFVTTSATAAPPDPARRKSPRWQLIPGLWYWTEEGGRFPRDPLKLPYYRTSKRLLTGAITAIASAVFLTVRAGGRRHKGDIAD